MNYQQPFLPEPEAVAVQPTKANGKKTLLLWIVLIVMFLAIWQFLSPSTPPHGSQAQDLPQHAAAAESAACSTSIWSSVPLTLFPLLFVIVMTVLFFRAYRQNTEFQLALEPGRLAMAGHRFAEAIEHFRALVPRFAKQPGYRVTAVLNVAEAQLRAGQFDGAIASCAEIERARTLLFGSAIRVRIATLTAFVYALRGDLATAEHWAANGRARIAKNREDRLGAAAYLTLAEAVIATRKGDAPGAIALLDRNWNELRYSLNADAMRMVEIIRAFAEAQGGVRMLNTVSERLVRVEPVTPGELAFLGLEWPEMKAFLGAHALS